MGHKPRTLNTQLTTENWIQTTLVPKLFVIINALANVETKYIQLAGKIRAKLEFFQRALRGFTRPLAVSFPSLWILHPLASRLCFASLNNNQFSPCP